MVNEPLFNMWMFPVAVAIVGCIIIGVVIIDPFPATEEECNSHDGTNERIDKWCDCKESWVGGSLNKSYTECHAKEREQR